MGVVDPTLTRVRYSATLGGTYTTILWVRSFELTEGEEGGGITRYFGGELDAAGNPTLNATMPCLFDRVDTTGQVALRAAKRAGTTVFLQFAPEGVGTGAKVEQFEARITEVTIGSVAEDDYVTGSFSFRGVPSTLSTVTLS